MTLTKEREAEIRGSAARFHMRYVDELLAALDECRKDRDERAKIMSHLQQNFAELRIQRDALQAQLDECRAKFDAMSLIADDHAMARVKLREKMDEWKAYATNLRTEVQRAYNGVESGSHKVMDVLQSALLMLRPR